MHLIPQPKRWEKRKNKFYVNHKTRIIIDNKMQDKGDICASILQACIKEWAGFIPAIGKGEPKEHDIFLTLDDKLSENEYLLVVAENEIME